MKKRQVSIGDNSSPLVCIRSSFANDKICLATASSHDIFTITDGTERNKVDKIASVSTLVNTLSWNRNNLIAVGGEDGTIPILDIEYRIKTVLTSNSNSDKDHHHGAVLACDWNVTGCLLASGGLDEMLCLWEPDQQKSPLARCSAHSDPILCVAFSPDGHKLATGSIDGLIRIWDVRSSLKRCLATIIDDDNPIISSIEWAPNGKFLITATMDSVVRVWDPEACKCVRAYRGIKYGKWGVARWLFSDNDSMTPKVVSGGVNGLMAWSIQTKQITFQEDPSLGAPTEILDFDYDRCNYSIFSISGKDNIVSIYDDLFN